MYATHEALSRQDAQLTAPLACAGEITATNDGKLSCKGRAWHSPTLNMQTWSATWTAPACCAVEPVGFVQMFVSAAVRSHGHYVQTTQQLNTDGECSCTDEGALRRCFCASAASMCLC